MANLTATAMNLLRQPIRFGHLSPPEGLWQIPTPYDEQIEAQWRRLMAEQHDYQKMARAITNVPAAIVPEGLTRNRHNKRLLLCQP